LISVDYAKSPEGNQTITAHFDKPQLTVIPETIMPLKDFAMKVLDDVQKSLATVSAAPVTEKQATSVTKVDHLITTIATVNLNEISIKLVDHSEILSVVRFLLFLVN
jgi:hypothetical protein